METTTSHLRVSSSIVLELFAALGLLATVACGSSAGGGGKDSGPDSPVDKPGDLASSEAQPRTDVVSPAVDAQPAEVGIDAGPGVDGAAVAVDSPQSLDLAMDQPMTMPETGLDSPTGVEAGDHVDAHQGTGGSGGSTAPSGGGAAGTSGSGGAGGTGGTGTGASGLVGWPNTSVDAPYVFGPASCNGAAQPAPAAYTFTLENPGSAVVTFTGASFSGATGYSVNLTAGASSIKPGESKAVTITPPAIPFPLSPPARYSVVLTLTTDEANDNVHVIHLTEQVHGAKLAWGTGAVSSYLGGAAPGSTIPLSQDFTIINTGDRTATVDITSSDPNFTISPVATGVEIPAGGAVVRTIGIIPPAIQGVYTASIKLVPSGTGNLCTALPDAWTASAVSIAGYPKFDPQGGTFPFSGACGQAQLAGRTVTITNVGTGPLKWLPVIVPGAGQSPCFTVTPMPQTPYSASDPTTWLTLEVGIATAITVQPNPIVAGVQPQCANQQMVVQFSSADAGGVYAYKPGDLTNNNYYNLSVTPLGDNLVISQGELDFGHANILKSPPGTTLTTKTLTIANKGWTDPLGSDTTATVNLSISSNDAFAFDASGSVRTMQITLPGSPDGQPGPAAAVTVYYLRPQVGPYTGGADIAELHWGVGTDRSCMCGPEAAACPTDSGVVRMKGQVVEGQVSARFADSYDDFGTVFCGATASARDYILTNAGDGPLTVNSATLDSDAYFSFTTSHTLPATIAPGSSMTFNVQPKMIPGADIGGPDDLGALSSKFSTLLTISTDARNPGTPNHPTIIAVPLKMYAQGIIIDPVEPSWSYPRIDWPASKSSGLTEWITNRGNVRGVATLELPSQAPPRIFSLASQTTVAANGLTLLTSEFGGDVFSDCNTTTANYDVPGQLVLTAEGLDQHARQVLNSSSGVCQAVNGPWRQAVILSGQLYWTESMCGVGQRCIAATPENPSDANAGTCVCDSISCGSGCCTDSVNGSCVAYANQTSAGCGRSGEACRQCTHPRTCGGGMCTCPSPLEECGGNCTNTNNDPSNCGMCGRSCGSGQCSGGMCFYTANN